MIKVYYFLIGCSLAIQSCFGNVEYQRAAKFSSIAPRYHVYINLGEWFMQGILLGLLIIMFTILIMLVSGAI